MADEFDAFLANGLAPPNRESDRAFVARVQTSIRLDDYLRAERRRVLTLLGIQILGVVAIAAGAFWVLRSPALADFAGESPAILLTVLLAAFSFLILLFSSMPGPLVEPKGRKQAFSKA